ncbi:nuclear pore complex protein Nup93-like [Paramacrobiotus metropolitanus]|uniref:nuclear pore complex protein Nup93-like n=1 Tax=Paramacrobiotus metropolitanus TaxID=2943436 RepID=UPI00244599A6|nr:nuclear pore complex protein Nup93-like [Paramacrobiotus metropolitanus]
MERGSLKNPLNKTLDSMDWSAARSVQNSSTMDVSYPTTLAEETGLRHIKAEMVTGYRSVLLQMNEAAGSNGVLGKFGTDVDGLTIRSLPRDVQESLDEKYLDDIKSLADGDRSFISGLQNRLKNAALRGDLERCNTEVLRDMAKVSHSGYSGLLLSQRSNLAKMKSSQAGFLADMQSGERAMTLMEVEYSRALRECNESILCSTPFDSVDVFFEKVKDFPEQNAVQLWKTFRHVISALSECDSDQDLVKFRESELFAVPLIQAARNFLETCAFDSIASRARVSPVPEELSTHSHVIITYTKSQMMKHKISTALPSGRIHNLPAWMLIFYSLRVGDVATAIEFANQGDSSTKTFVQYLYDYNRNQRRLSPEKERELRNFYSRQLPSLKEDPYKQACYSVIARTDSSESFGQITVTISDWLWLQLSRVELNAKGSTLPNLQSLVQQKFDGKNCDDLQTFLVYLLTGQFEAAIEKLSQTETYRIHAVHMAICLKQSNLLLVNNGVMDMISPDANELRYLDFVNLVEEYTAHVRKRFPDVACEYYFQLGDVMLETGADLAFSSFFEWNIWKLARDLADDMNKLLKLFGDVRVDASNGKRARVTGIIYKFSPNPESVIARIAEKFDAEGLFEPAVKLYEIAGQGKALMRTLLRELCDVVLHVVPNPRRSAVQKLAAAYTNRLQDNSENDLVMSNVSLLLDVLSFYELLDRKDLDSAIQILERSRFVPLNVETLRESLEIYQIVLTPDVRQCIPEVISHAARALLYWYQQEKRSAREIRNRTNFSSPDRNASMLQVYTRDRLLVLVEFCRLIPLPQCPELVQTLLNLESQVD